MTRPNAPKAVILVVDDFDDIRAALRMVLERHGYRPVEARDGHEAVQAAVAERPDLILMDLFMPKHDGFAAAREIRRAGGLSEVPIVAVSAYGELGIESQLQQMARAARFTEFVAKPFDAHGLLGLIERLLNKDR